MNVTIKKVKKGSVDRCNTWGPTLEALKSMKLDEALVVEPGDGTDAKAFAKRLTVFLCSPAVKKLGWKPQKISMPDGRFALVRPDRRGGKRR